MKEQIVINDKMFKWIVFWLTINALALITIFIHIQKQEEQNYKKELK